MKRCLCWVKTEIQVEQDVDVPSFCPSPSLLQSTVGKKINPQSDRVTYLVQNRYPATISDSSLEPEFTESNSNLLITGVLRWM